MSSYEDYGKASGSYDDTRVAVGTEILLGAFAAGPVPLSQIELLDAGCGTGTYAEAVAPKVGSVTLLDASEDMLAVARQKLGSAPRFDYRVGRLQDLPYADASFDAVMTNQVLHHVGDEEGAGWTEHESVFAEYARVLRPGGVLVVNTCSQRQLTQGYWYYALIPQAAEQLRRRYAPLAVIEQIAAAEGLVVTGRFVPVNVAIQGSAYLDGSGPLERVVAARRLDLVARRSARDDGDDPTGHGPRRAGRPRSVRRRARCRPRGDRAGHLHRCSFGPFGLNGTGSSTSTSMARRARPILVD